MAYAESVPGYPRLNKIGGVGTPEFLERLGNGPPGQLERAEFEAVAIAAVLDFE